LLCFLGGGNYDPQFERIGIITKMINHAISDAKAKGYCRIEAPASPEVIPVLEKCGFACKEIQMKNGGTQKYYYFDIV
ncbi:MAG: GNAT family N-acetyltransferase, partial [Oscillospiraceae bacterium]|nr:GNAT family N-acetyltransferase [Oscillospiraceae bacterium]